MRQGDGIVLHEEPSWSKALKIKLFFESLVVPESVSPRGRDAHTRIYIALNKNKARKIFPLRPNCFFFLPNLNSAQGMAKVKSFLFIPVFCEDWTPSLSVIGAVCF